MARSAPVGMPRAFSSAQDRTAAYSGSTRTLRLWTLAAQQAGSVRRAGGVGPCELRLDGGGRPPVRIPGHRWGVVGPGSFVDATRHSHAGLFVSSRGSAGYADGPHRLRAAHGSRPCQHVTRRELADCDFRYGEERASRRIARRIVAERQLAPDRDDEQAGRDCPGSGRRPACRPEGPDPPGHADLSGVAHRSQSRT